MLKTTLLGNFPFPGLLFTLLCNLIVLFQRKKVPPDSAREEPFGGFRVKEQIIYHTEKQLVVNFLHILIYV